MGYGFQQKQWGTARETRSDHGPLMLELASCMNGGVYERGGDAPMSLSSARKVKRKEQTTTYPLPVVCTGNRDRLLDIKPIFCPS